MHARACKLPTRVSKTSARARQRRTHHPGRELVGGAGAGGRGGAHGVGPGAGAAGRARGRRCQVEVPQGHCAGGRSPAGKKGRAGARQRGSGRNAHLGHDHVLLVRHVLRFSSGLAQVAGSWEANPATFSIVPSQQCSTKQLDGRDKRSEP
jgi:hypothetical protein